MSIACGSVGDIIALCLLTKDIVLALNDSRGSSAAYQGVIRELLCLELALLQVEQFVRTNARTTETEALYETACQTVAKCKLLLHDFKKSLRKFDSTLSGNESRNTAKIVARKLWWKASDKDGDVAKFRAELAGYTESINMLLATLGMATLSTHAKDLRDDFSRRNQRVEELLDQNQRCAKDVDAKLETCQQLASEGNSLGRRILNRLQSLESNLRCLFAAVFRTNLAVYGEILATKRIAMRLLHPQLSEEPFTFEDACGYVAPIHLSYIMSWDAFDAVLEHRFRGRPGFSKIRRREYELVEEATGRQVDRSLDIRSAILPGQRIVQDIRFVHEVDISDGDVEEMSDICPYCRYNNDEKTSTVVRCSQCSKIYRKIVQYDDDLNFLTFSDSQESPELQDTSGRKRKRGDNDDDDDDDDSQLACYREQINDAYLYCHFKRICIFLIKNETWEDMEDLSGYGREQELKLDSLESENQIIVEEEERLQRKVTEMKKNLEAESSSSPIADFLTCNEIWKRLSSCPTVQSGDFDLDAFCRDLQGKVKCSGQGAVVNEVDFGQILMKHLSIER